MEMPDLTPDMLLKAYAVGVFPMAEDRNDPELFWVDPRMRGVILLDQFHVPRSLRKVIRRQTFEITYDREFEAVIEACAESTEDRPRTWINDKIIELYTTLHRMGHAHSIETWIDGELAGGLYGVSIGRMFYGESMFSRRTDASKIALAHLALQLARWNFGMIDCQMNTRHLASLGAREIPRTEFIGRLQELVNYPDIASPWKLDHDLVE